MEAAGAGSALPSGLPPPHAAELSPWFGEGGPRRGCRCLAAPSKDSSSQGPPGHISLADHIQAGPVWRTAAGEEVQTSGAFLTESRQGVEFFFLAIAQRGPLLSC